MRARRGSPDQRAGARETTPVGPRRAAVLGSCALLVSSGLGACAAPARMNLASGEADARTAAARASDRDADRIFSASPAVWFEGFRAPALISPDGQLAIYPADAAGRPGLLDLGAGREAPGPIRSDLDAVRGAAFGPGDTLALRGSRGEKSGWFLSGPEGPRRLPLPADAVPQWSPDGERVAFFRASAPEGGLVVRGSRGQRTHPVDGRITRLGWLPDGRSLLALVVDTRGVSALVRIRTASAGVDTLVRDLDASPYASPVPVAVSPDGRRTFLALASAGAPDQAARHRPHADRDLDVYELDLETGARRAVVATPADEFAPVVADGRLYWTVADVEKSIVVVPRQGGPARVVVDGAMLPTWHPDGRTMGLTYGGWRAADWAVNWEGGVVDVDAAVRARGPPRPYITGYHEDFSPVWSPDGRWVAYHSHRAPTPVIRYSGPGSTDDIYLRRAGSDEETRLTDFGEEVGPPDWAPDGTQLVLTGWDPESEGGRSGAWIVTIDSASGDPASHRRLPLPEAIRGARNAAWSPGGNEIAIAAPAGEERQALWVVRPNAAAAREVVDYDMATYGGVDWTPDGETLVFPAVSGARMQLFAVPAAGGETRRLTEADANLLHPSVSPGGRWIAATRIVHRREIRRRPLP